MKIGYLKKLSPLLAPLGLLGLSLLFLSQLKELSPSMLLLIQYSSYPLYLIGLVLSYWFNLSRIFFIIITLALGQLALLYTADPFGQAIAVYSIVCILLPFNILILSLIQEHGVWSQRGRNTTFFIISQIFFTLWILNGQNSLAKIIFNPGVTSLTPIPNLSLFVLLITFGLLLIRLWIGRSTQEANFMGVLLSTSFAFHSRDNPLAVSLFFSISALLMVMAVIQDSYRKAYFDDLTGLPGRRALKEELAKLSGKYAIAMVDIDFFKKINDTYGHAIGDQALKFIASIIKNITGGGKAFRYGGEEFTIVFPGKKGFEVTPHLENLRETIGKKPFILRGKDRPQKKPGTAKPGRSSTLKIHISVSIGVAEKNQRIDTAEEVLSIADSALYEAKIQGRNRVCRG